MMFLQQRSVRVERVGTVAILTLDRPERRNAVNRTLLDELTKALRAANDDPSVRALVLRGAGPVFCAGDDLAEASALARDPAALARFGEALQGVSRLLMFERLPSIAAVQGWAIGAGFSWTLNCDVSVWSPDARGRLPEAGLGLFASGGLTYLLPAIVGLPRAREMLLGGRDFGAAELQACGIAAHVAPDPTDMALVLAQKLAGLPDGAVEAARRATLASAHDALDAAFHDEIEIGCAMQARRPFSLGGASA